MKWFGMEVRGSRARIALGMVAGWMLTTGSPANAQHLATGGSVDVSIVRVIAALLFSLAIGLGLIVVQRRYPGRIGAQRITAVLSNLRAGALANRLVAPRRINVIEARRISQHADMCLVRYGDEEFLVLASAGGATVLKTISVLGPEADPK